jgi:hypothetical protein
MVPICKARNIDLRTQGSAREVDRCVNVKIIAFAFEQSMRGDENAHKQIAWLAFRRCSFTLAR